MTDKTISTSHLLASGLRMRNWRLVKAFQCLKIFYTLTWLLIVDYEEDIPRKGRNLRLTIHCRLQLGFG